MGLLDDAIRQHLELKRQHGADPGDVAEQEHEALGPVKRGDLDVDTGTAEDVLVSEDAEPAFEDDVVAASETWVDEPEPAPEAQEPPLSVEPEAFEAPPAEPFAPTAAVDAYVPAPVEPPEPAPVPAPAPPAPAGDFEDIGEPTQEYSVLDDAPDPQPDPATGEHDELEQTPDFLEETPEHDRLWFEQKPPRDFDF